MSICDPTHRPDTLASRTIAGLELAFAKTGHCPTPPMWESLRAVADTLELMANSKADPVVYVSSLDPGVGKTSTVIEFLKALRDSPEHKDVSALVCVSRLDQIQAILTEATLDKAAFAVFTADKEMNQLGSNTPDTARIMFTTHRMIESRCTDRSFRSVREFHFMGRSREVRIWDEAILPGQTLTIARDDLGFLFKPLRSRYPQLTDDLDQLFQELRCIEGGTLMPLPDLADTHGVGLNDALQLFDGSPPDQVKTVEALWFMFGKTVSIHRDGAYGNTILDYRDTLPEDFRPLLALDASARVRTTYPLWVDGPRGGMTILPSATKSYERHTCHVWRTSGGKSAFRTNGPRLIEGIVKTILTRPDEEWLVVHHKNGTGGDVASTIRAFLPDDGPKVHFLNWGKHDATNAFASVPNVILAGTLFYRTSYYEALGRLAAGRPSQDGPFTSEERDAVQIGENRHLILQALSRGAVRRCVDGGCPETRSYIIASAASRIADQLPTIFPGVRIEKWQPVEQQLSGLAGEAFRYIRERLTADPDDFVPFRDVQDHINLKDRSNFNRMIRGHDGFRQALTDQGCSEWGPGRYSTGFQSDSFTFASA